MAKRWLFWIFLWSAFVSSSASSLRAVSPRQTSVGAVAEPKAIVGQYCVGCHNDKAKTAGLALNTVDIGQVGQNPEVWEKVLQKVRARYMPPVGRPRPDEAGYNSLVSYLETSLDRVATANPKPGRTETFHRLNRTEYQNAIRDLLAIDVDVASLLPKDDSAHGFDNVSLGTLPPTLLERYLTAAQKISRLALGSPVPSPGSDVFIIPADRTQEDHIEGQPFGTRGGATVKHTFPVDGKYQIQIRLSRDRNENVEGLTEPQRIELSVDGQQIQVFGVKPNRNVSGAYYADEGVDKDLHITIPLQAGPHTLGVNFTKRSSALIETERQPYQAHFNMDRHPRVQPAVYSISVAGPFDPGSAGDTPSRRRIFVCHPSRVSEEAGCAKNIVSTLARRAYRRPVTDADLRVPLEFYAEARKDASFEAGIEMALQALLTSTEFLFRIERDPAKIAPNSVYRISDLELASRLSFFLWSTIPDDELLEAAASGRLKQPKELEQQVRRMLADSRAGSLSTNFAGQWLYLRNLAAVSPDARTFPDFDDNLREAFRRETELLFESIMREDRSVLDLLRANYTFLNERLAKHYGIPNIYGSRFQRVTLNENASRGGLLGQGSILTVTSYANRTSPVLRGKWIMENVLGAAPPPPPPNVPPLPENKAGSKALSMRERMVQHRANPACSSCHNLMDPLGLSMENFDAIGRWRTRTESGAALDSAGSLPDGTNFEGMAGLKNALLKHPDLFATTVTEKLMTYGLGRGLEYYDAAAIRQIVRSVRNDDYHFSSIILGIVNSTPFQMRRSQ
jgi:mono/diheme cytochrome c family protein